MPRIAGISARCGPLNSAKPVANTVGTIAPPTKPWITRNSVIEWMSQAIPHSALARVNSPADSAYSQRVDSACARNAANGIITSSAIR